MLIKDLSREDDNALLLYFRTAPDTLYGDKESVEEIAQACRRRLELGAKGLTPGLSWAERDKLAEETQAAQEHLDKLVKEYAVKSFPAATGFELDPRVFSLNVGASVPEAETETWMFAERKDGTQVVFSRMFFDDDEQGYVRTPVYAHLRNGDALVSNWQAAAVMTKVNKDIILKNFIKEELETLRVEKDFFRETGKDFFDGMGQSRAGFLQAVDEYRGKPYTKEPLDAFELLGREDKEYVIKAEQWAKQAGITDKEKPLWFDRNAKDSRREFDRFRFVAEHVYKFKYEPDLPKPSLKPAKRKAAQQGLEQDTGRG